MASTAVTSGTAFLIACSRPALNVIILIAHEAQDPKSFNRTTLSAVISSMLTFPPSVSRYGRIESKACSTLSCIFITYYDYQRCKVTEIFLKNMRSLPHHKQRVAHDQFAMLPETAE